MKGKASVSDVYDFVTLKGLSIVQTCPVQRRNAEGRKFNGTAFCLSGELSGEDKEMIHKAWSNAYTFMTFCEYAPEITKSWVAVYDYTRKFMER